MAMNPANRPLYIALQEKSQSLFDYGQKILSMRTPANEYDVNREVERNDLELQRVSAVMSDLRYNTPMAFPSAGQLQAMQASVAALRNAIQASGSLATLIAAGNAVIAAWPQ